MEWKQYVDLRFINSLDNIKTRDKIPVICSNCDYVSLVIRKNLERQIKRINKHLCWGCSASASKKRYWKDKGKK